MLFKHHVTFALALITSAPVLAAPFHSSGEAGLSARDHEKREIVNLIVENILARALASSFLDTPGMERRDDWGGIEARTEFTEDLQTREPIQPMINKKGVVHPAIAQNSGTSERPVTDLRTGKKPNPSELAALAKVLKKKSR